MLACEQICMKVYSIESRLVTAPENVVFFFAGVRVCISAQRIYRLGQGKRSGYKRKILKRQQCPVLLAHDAFLCYLL